MCIQFCCRLCEIPSTPAVIFSLVSLYTCTYIGYLLKFNDLLMLTLARFMKLNLTVLLRQPPTFIYCNNTTYPIDT